MGETGVHYQGEKLANPKLLATFPHALSHIRTKIVVRGTGGSEQSVAKPIRSAGYYYASCTLYNSNLNTMGILLKIDIIYFKAIDCEHLKLYAAGTITHMAFISIVIPSV